MREGCEHRARIATFMLRSTRRLGLTLSLLGAVAVPAFRAFAQASPLPSQSAQASSTKATSVPTPAHKSKAHGKKSAPEPEVRQTPPPPPTLEQQPPVPPRVSYKNGQLTIDANNATLSQVLRSVQTQTGASIDMPSGAGSERVVASLGPGKPKDVLAALLNGSKFNYVILGEPDQSGGVQKVILLSKNSSSGDTATMTAQNNNRVPPQPQAVEPPEDEYPPPDQESDNQNQLSARAGRNAGRRGLNSGHHQATPTVINPGNRYAGADAAGIAAHATAAATTPAAAQPGEPGATVTVPESACAGRAPAAIVDGIVSKCEKSRPREDASSITYRRNYVATFPATSSASDSWYGARATPRSVMMAVTYLFGVTSNAGFSTRTASGAICFPARCVTSVEARCSIGILLPSGVFRSTVEIGAAT